jgi:hypothetical protein
MQDETATNDSRNRERRRGSVALGVAAAAFTVIALWGPLVLALGGGMATAMSFAPFLWIVVIGAVAFWIRSRARLRAMDARPDADA